MKYYLLPLLALSFFSCTEENTIPRPPSYLRLDLPDHTYNKHVDSCQYNFDLASIYKIEKAAANESNLCHRRIDLGPLNGKIYFRFWDMTEPLANYVHNANDEIDRHKIKATGLSSKQILRKDSDVYGAIFEFKGDVATPFQFYITDSTDHFVYGEVLFNMAPKYDSIKPTLDYLKKDLEHMLETFEWN